MSESAEDQWRAAHFVCPDCHELMDWHIREGSIIWKCRNGHEKIDSRNQVRKIFERGILEGAPMILEGAPMSQKRVDHLCLSDVVLLNDKRYEVDNLAAYHACKDTVMITLVEQGLPPDQRTIRILTLTPGDKLEVQQKEAGGE